MEDKRTAFAVLLSIVVVMVYHQVYIEPFVQQARQQSIAAREQAAASGAAAATPGAAAPSASVGAPAAPAVPLTVPTVDEITSSGVLKISSDLFTASISLLGGRLQSFTLAKYRHHVGEAAPYDMVAAAPGVALPLGVSTATESDLRTTYVVDGVSTGKVSLDRAYSIGGDIKEFAITLRGTLPSGIGIKKTFRFTVGSYLVNVETTLDKPSADNSPASLEWSHAFLPEEAKSRSDRPGFSILSAADKIQHVLDSNIQGTQIGIGAEGFTQVGPSKWIAYADRYFIAALIPTAEAGAAAYGKDAATDSYFARVAMTPTGGAMNLFVGPKDYRLLEQFTFRLDRSVDLGWFSFLAFPLLWLIRFFYDILGNYGLAIILLTLLIKTMFLPLTKASFDSMQKMQQLQPEMKALRDRITDPTQLNQEVMALYKRRGVNPMGGCFPVLIQIPVFLGLYNALLNSIELRHAPFALWINDLSSPEKLYVFGIGIPVMVLLMGASMIFQQLTTPSTMDPHQKRIMLMIPIIFTISFVIFPFPAGLVLYWLVNNMISITQQMYLRSEAKVSPLQATMIANLAIFSFGFVLTLL